MTDLNQIYEDHEKVIEAKNLEISKLKAKNAEIIKRIENILKPDITDDGVDALWILYDARNPEAAFRDEEKLSESIATFAAKYVHTDDQFERAKNELIKSSAEYFNTI